MAETSSHPESNSPIPTIAQQPSDRSPQHRQPSPDRRSPSPGPNRSKADQPSGHCLYVGKLSANLKDDDLDRVFGSFGKITHRQVMTDPRTRVSRGFGFVTFETREAAERAIAALHDTELEGSKLVVIFSRRGRPRTPTPGQYMGRLPRDHAGPSRGSDYDPRAMRYAPYSSRSYAPPPRSYDDRDRGVYYSASNYDSRDRDRDSRRFDDRYSNRSPSRGYDRRPPPPEYADRRGDYGGRGDYPPSRGGDYYDQRRDVDDYRRSEMDRRPPPPSYDDRRDAYRDDERRGYQRR